MARPERNTVDYFPHILGEGKKMFFIENKYGNDGYATWYKILEKLGSSDHHYLNLNREDELMFLAAKCKVSEETLLSIISDLVKIGAFDKVLWENKIIWCHQFVESIKDAYVKRKNKCVTYDSLRILLEGLGILKPSKLPPKGDGNTQTILEDTKAEETKEDLLNKPPILKSNFLRVGTDTFKIPPSEYLQKALSQSFELWKMQNEADIKLTPEALKKMDSTYIGYDFKDDNHVRNAFQYIITNMKKQPQADKPKKRNQPL